MLRLAVVLTVLAAASSTLAEEPTPTAAVANDNATVATPSPPRDDVKPSPPPEAKTPVPSSTAAHEAPATASKPVDPASASAASVTTTGRRLGDAVPLTRRELMLPQFHWEFGARYGLVGNGPTRFVDDIRFGVTDWLELRTSLLPYPSSLMARVQLGKQQSDSGAFLVDGGLAHFDAGLRLAPDSGEAQVGVRLHFEGGVAYAKALGERFSVFAEGRYRYRSSFLANDDQHAIAVDAHVSYDILDALAISVGAGFASTLGGPVRELSVNFVETSQAGISHLLARDDGDQQSVTIPLSLTYGRVENFDVDLFCTTKVYPTPGVLFGAGIRLRS
jgi:hypothetical protein